MPASPPSPPEEIVSIAVVGEQLHVGVRERETGRGVRLHTTVSERVEQVDEQLRHENVEVERVTIDRVVAADQAPTPHYEGDTLVVPILEEVLVLERRIRIKEEVRITRRVHHARFAQDVPLRSEHLEVERFDAAVAPTTAS